jgi:hypothetical protein
MTRAITCCALAVVACGGGSGATTDATIDAASDAPSSSDPCVHVPGAPASIGVIAGLPSTELSGLAASRTLPDLLWTHGDRGGAAELYSVSATNAAPHGTLRLDGATAFDWEDLAAAPCPAGQCIYIADTGDNNLDRTGVAIYEVVEPTTAPIGAIDVAYTRYDIQYPDGPHDVEAIFVDPRDGRGYAITKTTERAAVYLLPRVAGASGLAQPIAELTIPAADPRVTAADLAVDACSARLLIRTYAALYELRAAATATIAELMTSALATMPVAAEPHGEAVAYAADGRAYYTTSEGASPTLHRVAD